VPLLFVPTKPNFREKELHIQAHVLLHKTLGFALKTKSTNKTKTKYGLRTEGVFLIGWEHGAWATDKNFLPYF
jgi:hypothetical protein